MLWQVLQTAARQLPANCDNCQSIPRSHRFARSRPLTLREGGVRFALAHET